MTDRPTLSAALPLRALIVANYVSWFGNGLTIVAIPLFVLETTGSPLITGLAGFANALPLAFGGILGGVLADRLSGRLVSVVSDLLAALIIVMIPLLYEVGDLPIALLLALLVARTLVDAPGGAARLVLLDPLTKRADAHPESVNGLFNGAPRVALVIGPAVAALMAGFVSPTTILYLDGATFALSAVLVWAAVPATPRSEQDVSSRVSDDLREGLRLVSSTPALRAILAVVVVTNFLDDALAPVVLPLLSRDVLGDARWTGLLVAMFGAGTIVGTLAFGPLSRRILRNKYYTFVGAFTCVGIARTLLALDTGVAGAAVLALLLGLAAGPLSPLITTAVQQHTPPAMQGRVFGVVLAVAFAAAPFGILAQSWLIDVTSVPLTIALAGIVYAFTIARAATSPGLRSLGSPKEVS